MYTASLSQFFDASKDFVSSTCWSNFLPEWNCCMFFTGMKSGTFVAFSYSRLVYKVILMKNSVVQQGSGNRMLL
jgi:hypothetical protein